MSVDMAVLRAVMNGCRWAFAVWEPSSPMVVVGRGGDPEKEVNAAACRGDGVPVYQRRTGGGTVVLSPGVLVFSLGRIVSKPMVIKEYQEMVNDLIVEFLDSVGVMPINRRGISDLCIGEKKILGSGMYRRQFVLFFQGSLLVNPDTSLMERYLLHPPREPEYRRGRPHCEFITTLQNEGYPCSAASLKPELYRFLQDNVQRVY